MPAKRQKRVQAKSLNGSKKVFVTIASYGKKITVLMNAREVLDERGRSHYVINESDFVTMQKWLGLKRGTTFTIGG